MSVLPIPFATKTHLSFYTLQDVIFETENMIIYRGKRKQHLLDKIGITRAIKIIIINPNDFQQIKRVQCYYELMKEVQNSHVIKVYDCFFAQRENRTEYWVEMDYCHYNSLKEFYLDEQINNLDQKISFISDISIGLTYIYNAIGFHHYYLCPENLLLQRNNASIFPKLKINNFGLLDDIRDSKGQQLEYHNLLFQPPEYFHEFVHPKSDVWSFGMIIFYLMTGKIIFDCIGIDCFQAIANQTPLPFGDYITDQDCLDLLYRSVIYEPDHRISMAEMLTHPFINRCQNIRLNNQFDNLKELRITKSKNMRLSEMNENQIELPSLEKLTIFRCENIIININSPCLKTLCVYSTFGCGIIGNINCLKQLYISLSNEMRIENMTIENKYIRIESSKYIASTNGDKIIPFNLHNITYDQFNDYCENIFQLPNENMNFEEISNRFEMNSFGDYYNNRFFSFDENNQLILTEKILNELSLSNQLFLIVQSHYFCWNNYDEMEIMTNEGKKIIPANVRYFEVKTIGYNNVSIGLSQDTMFDNDELEYGDNTTGLNNMRKEILCNGEANILDDKEIFIKEECVIGCGYDLRNGEVFFTKDGKKIWQGEFINKKEDGWEEKETDIVAVVQIKYLTHIEINTGKTIPFIYDLENEYHNENLNNEFNNEMEIEYNDPNKRNEEGMFNRMKAKWKKVFDQLKEYCSSKRFD